MRIADFVGSSRLGLVLKLGVSAGLIVLVCEHIQFASLIDQIGAQSLAWLVATVLLGLMQVGILSYRWQQILRGLGSEGSFVSALSVTFMGCFFGAFLFGQTGGDVARAVLAPPRSLGRQGVVHSVLFERLASVIGLGLAAMPVVVFNLGPQAHSLPVAGTLAVVPLSVLAVFVVAWLARAFHRRGGALFHALRELDNSRQRLMQGWPRVVAAVALATVGQALVAVEAWCLSQSQHLGVPLVDFAILMPPVMLIVALPISAGGWGVREGVIVAALALIGVGTAPALLLSVELGLIGALVSLPGGVIWAYRLFTRPAKPNPLA